MANDPRCDKCNIACCHAQHTMWLLHWCNVACRFTSLFPKHIYQLLAVMCVCSRNLDSEWQKQKTVHEGLKSWLQSLIKVCEKVLITYLHELFFIGLSVFNHTWNFMWISLLYYSVLYYTRQYYTIWIQMYWVSMSGTIFFLSGFQPPHTLSPTHYTIHSIILKH